MSGSTCSSQKEFHSKKKHIGLVEAAEVLFGEYIPVEDCPLLEEKTPETFLLQKSFFQELSGECRTMADIIITLPEEMFLINGRIKIEQLFKTMKERSGWSKAKTRKVKTRLEKSLVT